MNKQQLQYFRKHLEEERALVTAQLREHSSHPSAGSDREVRDRSEEAEENAERVTQDALAGAEDSFLKKIDLALKRIDEGVYGTCVVCGEEIPLDRLHAKPSALHCIKCQEKKEEKPRR